MQIYFFSAGVQSDELSELESVIRERFADISVSRSPTY